MLMIKGLTIVQIKVQQLCKLFADAVVDVKEESESLK